MKRSMRIPLLLLVVALVIVLDGCGGSSYTPPPPPPPVVNVSITTPLNGIDQGQSFNFAATTDDASGKGVTWSLSGPGTLTNTTSTAATYDAPSSVSSSVQVTLTATSITNSADFSSMGFSVAPLPTIAGPMPDGNVGTSYSANIPTTGGTGNFTFALTNGTMLPPGLTMSPSGFISGIPLFPAPHTYNFTATVTDASPGGTVTSPAANVSININPPLPLMIITPMPPPASIPMPEGGVNIDYNTTISATGGVQPYIFSLAAGSNPIPNGLALTTNANTNQGVISGKPTAAVTTNIILQVSDAQAPPAVSPPVTFSLKIDPSTNFVGTQAPGDIWEIVIAHSSPTNGIFEAKDQGAGGLPGITSSTLIRTFLTTNAGFRQYFLFFRFFFRRGSVFGNAVEMEDEMELMQPGGVGSKVVAAVANTCPQLSAPTNYQFVALPTKMFTTTNPAYGIVGVTQTSKAPNTYNLSFNTFQLDGTSNGSSPFPNVACDSTLQVLSFAGTGGGPVTMAFSGHGALVIDNGTGIPAVGVQQPPSNLSTSAMSAILAGQYLGVVFQPNAQPANSSSVALITQMVGFGPNTGTTLTGGTYSNIGSDPFSAHAVDHVITLGTQTSPGLFTTGGTLAIGIKTITNFDVVAGQVNGKFVLYGVTLDSSNSSSPQPIAVLLIQQ